MQPPGRRTLLGTCLASAAGTGLPRRGAAEPVLRLTATARPGGLPFRAAEFNTVGVFDADWLADARYGRMLDTMAASPGAFGGVRFFGALNAGSREHDFPTASGGTWLRAEEAPDFTTTLGILDGLVRRGLTPFVALTFFPPAVSPDPIAPPARLDGWERLVRAFLDAATARFGAAELSRWWLEAWNEPNMPQFWRGGFDRYLDLYRATARAVGPGLRLGGPAIAWLPDGSGPRLMERFLRLLAEDPGLPCDFLSFHRKGAWEEAEGEPRVSRLVEAAEATAELALRLVPERCARGLAIVNNEADMRVGFQHPYAPRMSERFPSWLAATAAAHVRLSARYAPRGLRFVAAADNANQHLVREPFDGRRALMTPTAADRSEDLVKLPVFGFYEMLRLLGDGLCAAEAPEGGVFQLVTADAGRIGALLTHHPAGAQDPVALDWVLTDIPWDRVNLVVFRIDGTLSNAFAASGRRMPSPAIGPAEAGWLRQAAELALAAPPRHGIAVTGGRLALPLRLDPFATVLVSVTPVRETPPAPPQWAGASLSGGNAVLTWTGEAGPDLLGYELVRLDPPRPAAPVPLRGTMWVDTAAGPSARYEIRAVSMSGLRSAAAASPPLRPG
jgi:xylan 1,4-beta-xylosidase